MVGKVDDLKFKFAFYIERMDSPDPADVTPEISGITGRITVTLNIAQFRIGIHIIAHIALSKGLADNRRIRLAGS